MNIFLQGMRRSGTTIVFDILSEDPSFDCYYEPLAAAKKSVGGGSGIRPVDFFEKIREIRASFKKKHIKLDNVDLLNYGAPRAPFLEFEEVLPDFIREYIKEIISKSGHTAIKFTRMSAKVGELFKIDPYAKFIHLVRDPRAVTASYLFGKNQKYKQRFGEEKIFFGKKTNYSAWSSYPFSEFLLDTTEYTDFRDCEDFLRILILWKYNFEKTHKVGQDMFKKKYLLLRHEDLVLNPLNTLQHLYNFIEQPLPEQVEQWAIKKLKKNFTCFASDSEYWGAAFDRLEMKSILQEIGYWVD